MVVLSVFILFIIFESSKLLSNAVNTYCTLPCPFMCPAQQPKDFGIMLPPRRPIGRTSYDDTFTDYNEAPESEPPPLPPPVARSRQEPPPDPEPPASPSPQPKPKPKPSPAEVPEPPPKKKNSSTSPSSPSIQPSRRFFTSLFSIPGAVVDTMIGGEITL